MHHHGRHVDSRGLRVVATPTSAHRRSNGPGGCHAPLRLPPRLIAVPGCTENETGWEIYISGLRLPPRLEAEVHGSDASRAASVLILRLPLQLDTEVHEALEGAAEHALGVEARTSARRRGAPVLAAAVEPVPSRLRLPPRLAANVRELVAMELAVARHVGIPTFGSSSKSTAGTTDTTTISNKLRLPPRPVAEVHQTPPHHLLGQIALRLPLRIDTEAHMSLVLRSASGLSLRLSPRLVADAHMNDGSNSKPSELLRLPPQRVDEVHCSSVARHPCVALMKPPT